MRTSIVVSIVSLVCLAAPPAVNADTLSPGKTVAATAGPDSGTQLSGGSFAFGVSLERAKRHTVIFIDATVSTSTNSAATMREMEVKVDNGFDNELAAEAAAQGGVFQTQCESLAPCVLSGHWWVDVDQLEAEGPGYWANLPINIHLSGDHTPAVASALSWYSLRAQMIKK
jgi:hypothetical protein